jgi:hypothetical protein
MLHQFREDSQAPIYQWLMAHKDEIRNGTAEFMGTPVTEKTRLYQFTYVVSFGVVTIVHKTPYLLPSSSNGYLRLERWKYTFLSLVLGWWGIPFGPIFTIQAVWTNMSGGTSRTAINLLQRLEYGWDAPSEVSSLDHCKEIAELSERALIEIQRRIELGKFPQTIGVRISPVRPGSSELQVTFDYPVSDGRDWIDESQGKVLLIRKDDEVWLSGCTIEFDNGVFLSSPRTMSRQ